jgi:hypothetical protein
LARELMNISATFDEPYLVSRAGLIPMMALPQRAALDHLAAEHGRVSRPCGVNAQVKVPCLVGEMVSRADSIDDMDARSV